MGKTAPFRNLVEMLDHLMKKHPYPRVRLEMKNQTIIADCQVISANDNWVHVRSKDRESLLRTNRVARAESLGS